jgi:transposase
LKAAWRIRAVPAAVTLRQDASAEGLGSLARRSKDAKQSRRLLSLAAIRDGMDRGEAAKIGGMDRQTWRDWVHRFNAQGPDGLFHNWTDGPTPRLSGAQLAELAWIVETGPDLKTDGVLRRRRVDLQGVISARFGVDDRQRHVGKLLEKLGFSPMSARPRHPAQDRRILEASFHFMFRPHGAPIRRCGSLRRSRPRSPGGSCASKGSTACCSGAAVRGRLSKDQHNGLEISPRREELERMRAARMSL